MTANSNSFAEFVLSQVDDSQPFKPQVIYDKAGDCIEFLFSNEPFYGKRIDSLVTVYYSDETQEIVGSLIKGVKRFISEVMKKAPGFRIDVYDGRRIKLEHLFTAKLWSEEPAIDQSELVIKTYRILRDKAEEFSAEAELELCETMG